MNEPTLEQRVAALEKQVAALQGAQPVVPNGNWVERMAGWFANDPVYTEMMEYGRYFRKTGQEPPAGWKPGDPIPEPGDGEELP